MDFHITVAGSQVIESHTYKKKSYRTEIQIWDWATKQNTHRLSLPGYGFKPKISACGEFIICAQMQKSSKVIQYQAVNLNNYQTGMVYQTNGFNACIIHPTLEYLIIGTKKSIIRVQWKEAVGYAWYEHMQQVYYAQQLNNTKSIVYNPTVSEITVFPSMVRLTHVYTAVQATSALEQAFLSGMKLYWTASGINEFHIAFQKKNQLWTPLLAHLTGKLRKKRIHMSMLDGGWLPWLIKAFPKNDWVLLLKHLMSSPPAYNPKIHHLNKKFNQTDTYDESPQANLDLFKDNSKDKVKTEIKYLVSAVQFDVARWSLQCIDVTNGLIDLSWAQPEILRTDLVIMYANVMWSMIWWQTAFDSVVMVLFSILQTLEIIYSIKNTYYYILMLLMILYWVITQMSPAFRPNHKPSWDGALASEINKIVFSGLHYIFALIEYENDGTRFTTTMALYWTWIFLIGTLRIFKAFRYMLRMVAIITGGIGTFMMVYLLYVMAVTFMLMTLRDTPFDDTWQLAYRLGYGDFEELYEGYAEKTVFLCTTIILNLLLLNLVIAIMAQKFTEVKETHDIEDVREKLRWVKILGIMAFWDKEPRMVYLHAIKSTFEKKERTKAYINEIKNISNEMTKQKFSQQKQFEGLENNIRDQFTILRQEVSANLNEVVTALRQTAKGGSLFN